VWNAVLLETTRRSEYTNEGVEAVVVTLAMRVAVPPAESVTKDCRLTSGCTVRSPVGCAVPTIVRLPAKPLRLVRVQVDEPEVPTSRVRDPGLQLMLKSDDIGAGGARTAGVNPAKAAIKSTVERVFSGREREFTFIFFSESASQ